MRTVVPQNRPQFPHSNHDEQPREGKPERWYSKAYLSRVFARRPAQLLALLGFVIVVAILVYVFAGGQESTPLGLCSGHASQTTCSGGTVQLQTQTSGGGGWWHTSGQQILDSSGTEVYLRGVDDGRLSPPWSSGDPLPPTEFSNLSGWGFTFIRLAISWNNIETSMPTKNSNGTYTHHWNSAYLSEIDTVVAHAKAAGLRIVLDLHQAGWAPIFGGHGGFPNWVYPNSSTISENQAKCDFLENKAEPSVDIAPQDGIVAVWQMLATRYQNDSTVVGADMFNEPQTCNVGSGQTYNPQNSSTPPLDAFYSNVATAIQAINPNILLIYEDDAYQTYLNLYNANASNPALTGFAVTRKLSVPNAVYSFHMYPDSWTKTNSSTDPCAEPATTLTGQNVYANHLARDSAWNQPMYIGEFDGFHLDSCSSLTSPTSPLTIAASSSLQSMMSAAKSNNANWSLWEYDRNSAIIDSSGQAKEPLLDDLKGGL